MGGFHAFDVWPFTLAAEAFPSEVDFSCQSLQQLMCATPRAPSAARQAASTRRMCVRRPHHLLIEDGNILEEVQQVDLLLVMHPHEVMVRLSGDREHRMRRRASHRRAH